MNISRYQNLLFWSTYAHLNFIYLIRLPKLLTLLDLLEREWHPE